MTSIIIEPAIEKMHKARAKMMLDYFGAPLKHQPVKIGEVRGMLQAFKNADLEKYQEAYNAVVLHKTEGTKVKKVLDIVDASKIIETQIKEIESGALKKIDSICKTKIEKREADMLEYQKNFVGNVKEKFEAAVARESKKFNVTAIKINSCKPRKVKGVVHEEFPRMIQLAMARKNILLVGPSGCGKTHVAEQLADQLEMRYSSQSCSAGVSESVFSGWLIPIGKAGQFVYVTSQFVDMYENGGIFLFDEMDNSDANVLVFLNQALANGKFFLPQRTENPLVKKHKDFVAIGCANTFGGGADGMYHGRIALDAATLDRFKLGTIFMDYSPEVEESLIDPVVLEWGREIRKAISDHKLKKLMSTRVMIDATDMKRICDWTINDMELGYFADWSREEKASCGFQLRGVK